VVVEEAEEMKFMEENLNMPLKEVLNHMQKESFKSTYFGINCIKSPLDFWIYQEIIFDVKPDIIIEIGNLNGGHTLALAHILDNLGNDGKVIGLDINHDEIPSTLKKHPKITLITGDACQNFQKVKDLIDKNDKVLIIEDSSHTYENTLNVLRTFSPLVTEESWFIIEDSICHHGLDEGPNPGPYEAIETFVKENKNFEVDRSKERFIITWNPKGYLRRIKCIKNHMN
jgi:cephalosporin hydroxylase